ncbi:hypothetical protein C1646_675419 [Rhizophagus diaphanus]|nr:hypothetical protein C1646_675419 [Rhizophagus diaphanus] [Rhizophagus sp. MUCL 43196]
MEQSLLIVSGPSDGNNKFGLSADNDDDDDEFWLFDDDNEEDDDIEDDDVFSSKLYDGWDYKKEFGEDAWEKLYRDRLVNVLSFLDYSPCAFPIYLIKQKMDYLSHFLDLIHLGY